MPNSRCRRLYAYALAIVGLAACSPTILAERDFAPPNGMQHASVFRGTLVVRPVDVTLGCTGPNTTRALLLLRTENGYLPLTHAPASCVSSYALHGSDWVSVEPPGGYESRSPKCGWIEPLDASALGILGASEGDAVTLTGVLGPVFARGRFASSWVSGIYVKGPARR